MDSTISAVFLIIFGVLGVVVYFIPTMVASGKNRQEAVFALNLLLGWTLVGWVGALIWAMCEKERTAPRTEIPQTVTHADSCQCPACRRVASLVAGARTTPPRA